VGGLVLATSSMQSDIWADSRLAGGTKEHSILGKASKRKNRKTKVSATTKKERNPWHEMKAGNSREKTKMDGFNQYSQ